MTSLNTTIRAGIAWTAKKSLDLRDVTDNVQTSGDILFGSGTGTGRAQTAFADTRTLAASTSENLDLAGGLTDAYGGTITFTKVRAIEVTNPAASLSNLSIGGAASNGFLGPFADPTDIIILKPGDKTLLISSTGWTVTAGTGDILKVANGAGGSVNYDIKIVGE